jgi:protein-disulfide isomerase
MASRKEQKEQARAQRLAKEQELAQKASRTRRIQIFGGAIVAAVIVVVVAIAVSSGGSKTAPISPTQAKSDYAAVSSLLSGIPQHGVVLGDTTAPVTLTYFGDLECPICQEFTLGPFPQFIQDQVRTGNVKVEYRSLCTATCNDHSQALFNQQQVAAYAAGSQSLFWDYAELFYHEQQDETSDYVNTAWLLALAKQIPKLDIGKWQTDQGDPALLAQVQADEKAAVAILGAQNLATPSLFMTGKKGTEQVLGSDGGVPTYNDLAAAVQAVS